MTLLVASLIMAAGPASADERGRGRTTYQNPLAPTVPGSTVASSVESCADPTALKGQRPGDDHWYLYCTTDPLNDQDRGPDGTLNFHPIPTSVSTDLVHWTYAGDALPQRPGWATPTAGLWAPEVVYSPTFDRYYLFFVVTDVTDNVSGVPGCASDSAIGVATSTQPTGPWTASDTPVVAPRQNGPGCDFFWTYDPDVLGDSVATQSTLYYGSYYGGIKARTVTLTPTGATAGGAETPITIGNKYEGANVVQRGGYYYLFVSATNCCNGPLTGYSVFAGRSTSPLGPFVDREGASLLAGRTGGTPVISMNGNRWVGTGHNTVFQDAAGQWWTIYHAVDRTDPYFAGSVGFTRRPALLDPLDWVDGWPTVRGGLWASDEPMPAPAAQPGDRERYRPQRATFDVPRKVVDSDGFGGTALSPQWQWVREPAADQFSVGGGVLSFRTQAGDLYVDSNTAPVLTRSAPVRGDYVVETKVRLDVPAEGCCFNYRQAGLVVYGGDDAFVKLATASIWETRQSEFAKEIPVAPQGFPRYGNTVVGAPGEWTWLRIVKHDLPRREQIGGDTASYTAYTSADGTHWVKGGTWTHQLGPDVRIGLVAMGGEGSTATFDYVTVSTVKEQRVR